MIETLNQVADKWFTWELAMLWQVTVLIAIVGAVDFLSKKWAWPQVRYALWLLVMLKLVLPPTLSSPTSFTADIPFLVEKAVKVRISQPEITPKAVDTIQPAEPIAVKPIESLPSYSQTTIESIPIEEDAGMTKIAPEAITLSLKAYFFCVWLIVIIALSSWLIIRLSILYRVHLSKRKHENLLDMFMEILAATAQKLNLRTVPKVIVTDKVHCPAVFGVFRRVLLMPASKFSSLTRQEAEHILLHELAHIKRGDLIIHAVYTILQIVYWFNPLLWLIRRQLQNLRELCCDATVARILKEKTFNYSETLLVTARELLAEPIGPGLGLLGLFENSNLLLDRLKWLEKKTWKNRPRQIATIIILVGIMLGCVLPMAKATKVNNDRLPVKVSLEHTTEMRRWGGSYYPPKSIRLSAEGPPHNWLLPQIDSATQRCFWAIKMFGGKTIMNIVIHTPLDPKAGAWDVFTAFDEDVDFSSTTPISIGVRSRKEMEFNIAYGSEAKQPYVIRIRPNTMNPGRYSLSYWRWCLRTGTADVLGKEYRITLIDDDSDGLYSDGGTTVLVRHYADGHMSRSGRIRAVSPIEIGESEYFTIEINDDGSSALLRPAEYGILEGYVTRESSKIPVPNARVKITPHGFETLTGPDGRYEMRLPVGKYSQVQISANGYIPQHVRRVPSVSHATAVNVSAQLHLPKLPQSGEITLRDGDSYHFLSGQRHRYTGGDFYFKCSKDNPTFWANNSHQGGLVDLGQSQTPLDAVRLPIQGYTQRGILAVVGHVYASLAKQGEDDCHIVFRVTEIKPGESCTLKYYYRQGDLLMPYFGFTEALEINPKDAQGYFNRGLAFKNKGEYEQAISDFTKAIEINPRYAEAYGHRGAFYCDVKDEYDMAISDFTKAIEINPRYADFYYFRGVAYSKKGDNDRAISDYNRAIEINQKYAKAYNNRGFAFKNKGEYEQAISDFTKAIEIIPKDAKAYNHRGIIYCDVKGEYDLAISDFTKAIEINPRYAEFYHNRGVAYDKKGDNDRAISDYNKAIEINQKYAGAYSKRGFIYSKKGDNDRAILDFSKAIEINPKDARAYMPRGITYFEKDEYDQAILDFSKAIEINQKDARAYCIRGISYSKKGEYDRAIADYNKALEINPNDAFACNYLAWFFATCPDGKYRDGRKAVDNATRACELSQWTRSSYLDTLAAAYAELDDFDQAVKWQLKAIELATPEYNMTVAQSILKLYKAGKPYREELSRAITSRPADPTPPRIEDLSEKQAAQAGDGKVNNGRLPVKVSLEHTTEMRRWGITYYRSQNIRLSAEKPPQNWVLPQFLSATQRRFWVRRMFGGKTIMNVVIHTPLDPKLGEWDVFMTFDEDVDFSSTKPINIPIDSRSLIKFNIDYKNGAKQPYVIRVMPNTMNPGRYSLICNRECIRTGTADILVREHKIVLSDDDVDGLYSDLTDTTVIIDHDADGLMSRSDRIRADCPIKIGLSDYFTIEINDDGSSALLRPAEYGILEGFVTQESSNTPVPNARVKITPHGFEALTGPDGRYEMRLPVGRYYGAQITASGYIPQHVKQVPSVSHATAANVSAQLRLPTMPQSGEITLHNSESYHFLSGQRYSRPVGGDFYFGFYKDNPEFWANNRHQGGLVDLGQIQTPLDAVTPPTQGYSRFGVLAEVGHIYVSPAKQGEDDCHIVFRVTEIKKDDSCTLKYYYRQGETTQ